MSEKHLFIVAHGDDEVLSSGGTIKRLSEEGDEVFVLYVARRVYNHKYSPEMQQLLLEQIPKVQKILGFKDWAHLQVDDEHLYGEHFLEVIDGIEQVMATLGPCHVWTHRLNDFNQVHRQVSEAVEIATRRYINTKSLRWFEVPTSTENSMRPFEPNYFVDITDYIRAKNTAMMVYVDQLTSYRNTYIISDYAKYRGLFIQKDYAEAFQIVKWRV